MIEVEQVTHRFGDRQVLSDVSVTLDERRIAVIGANGSGKSTFARLLNGLQLPTRGRVLVDGADTRRQGREVRRRVGFGFQNPDNQIVFPVVSEDLAFGLRHLGLPADEVERRIDDVLERYDLAHLRNASTYRLSGGEKQLIALAGVLLAEPEYVVLDEPLTLLDLRNKRRVAQVVAALPQTVVVVSHDLEFLGGFDRALVFDDGRIAVDDMPQAAVRAYVELLA
jgi:biotin transport system ATP-binding protein